MDQTEVTGDAPAEKSPEFVMLGLRVGDVVQLNSGGQAMTVVRITEGATPDGEPGPTISCGWFTDDGVLRFEDFPQATVRKKYQPIW